MRIYDIQDRKEAIIILFHEVMWDTFDSLIEQDIIEKPIYGHPSIQTKKWSKMFSFAVNDKNSPATNIKVAGLFLS